MPRHRPTRTALFVAVIALFGLFAPWSARLTYGQSAEAGIAGPEPSQEPPAHISFVDGSATLERDGRPDSSPASMPLLAGDRLRTGDGRVEVLFADGSTLHLDRDTLVDFQSDEVVRLLRGRLRLNISGRDRTVAYRIDAPAGWVQIVEPGEFRVAVLEGQRGERAQTELAVLRGAAELINEDGRSLVRAGERAFAAPGARPSTPYVFNSAAWDAFDQWSEARRDERLGASAQYLPPDVQPYAARFDAYGYWRHEPVHGYVWYPRVRPDWRPYYHGRWVSLRPYGWTWIAADPWGWPTHHYGRWGFSAGSWFWIPGRRWGAAWVSWAHAADYVSWCPLGWNDRPVFSLINVNVYRGRRYDPWHAWTVVPRRHFRGGFVNVHVVPRGRFDDRFRRSFVARDHGPDWRQAVPRASTPIRVAGTRTGYAVPRGSASAGPSSSDRFGSSSARSFPAPSRTPRTAADLRGAPERNAQAPVTAGPSRAVPREAVRPGGPTAPAPRRWEQYDRPSAGSAAGAPQYRRDPGAGSREGYRAPDRGADDGARRAVPRREASPSYEAPRPYEAPRSREAPRSYEAPRSHEAPRSYEPPRRHEGSRPAPTYDTPRPERSPGGYRPERSAAPRAEPPAHSAPPPQGGERSQPSGGERPSAGPSSGARPRGGAPAQGQAVPRRSRG